MLSSKEISMLIEATGTSVYMTLASTLMAYVIGLPIGILLVVCAPGGLKPKAVLYKILDFIVNITRSIPFLILMLLATPLARLVTGKSYGANATIISLTLAAAPFIARPQEFTAALQAYAEEKEMQFTLTKEGMYPEFLLDGIAYKAYRNPGKYRDEICCDALHPEQLDTGLPPQREKLLHILRIAVPPVCTFAAILAAGWVVTGGAGWLWLAVLASAGVLLGRCFEKWL